MTEMPWTAPAAARCEYDYLVRFTIQDLRTRCLRSTSRRHPAIRSFICQVGGAKQQFQITLCMRACPHPWVPGSCLWSRRQCGPRSRTRAAPHRRTCVAEWQTPARPLLTGVVRRRLCPTASAALACEVTITVRRRHRCDVLAASDHPVDPLVFRGSL